MNGLNGDKVLDVEGLTVGRVPGAEYGYKRDLRVTIGVRMERLTRREEYETTDHRKVTKPLDFAITTQVWQPDGRDIVMSTPGDGMDEILTGERYAELRQLAKFHLNAMRAGCAHGDWVQEPVHRQGRYGQEVDLDATASCPQTGYRYGHAWLVEELPEGFEQRVRNALAAFGWKE